MFLTSKGNALFILGLTALICSRVFFTFIDDPEGPNLLIVIVLATVIYLTSLAVYIFNFPTTHVKKFLVALLAQVLLIAVLYFLLN